MKKELEGLFRDAERLLPPPELWERIARQSSLASAQAPAAPHGTDAKSGAGRGRDAGPLGTLRALKGSAAGKDAQPGAAWEEAPYLRAAAVILAAALLGLAAFGFFRRPAGEPVREAAVSSAALAGSAAEVFDPELLDWQASLGDFETEADETVEAP